MTLSVTSAEILYRYGEASQTEADVRYAYSQTVASTSEADMVYRYGLDADACRFEAKAGHWAWTTQELGDYFPRWHMARHSVGGPTQRLINSWGMGFDDVKRQFGRFRKSLFLTTAETEEPDQFHHAGVFNYTSRDANFNNFLTNPTFAFRGLARHKRPVFWTTHGSQSTGTVEVTESPAFIGTHSLLMHADAGESCYLSQDLVFPFREDSPFTCSLWYMSPMSLSTVADDAQVASLYCSVMYADGTMEIKRTALSMGTAGFWKRAWVTLDPTKEVFLVRFGVQLQNSSAKNVRFYLGAAQLELAENPTVWTEGQITELPQIARRVPPELFAYIELDSSMASETINAGDTVSYTAKTGRSLYYVDDYFSFWEDATPMRATISVAPSTVPTSLQRLSMGWYMTIEGERFTTFWRIADNKIEQYNSEVPTEIAATFDIAERYLDDGSPDPMGIFSSTEDASFSRTLEALCIHKNLLWVLCLESQGGTTMRVLKVLDPYSRYPLLAVEEEGIANVHLECLGDVDVGMATGTADYIAPTEEDPDQFVLRIDDTYYVLDLEFDYYMLATRERQAILRHDYEGASLVTV